MMPVQVYIPLCACVYSSIYFFWKTGTPFNYGDDSGDVEDDRDDKRGQTDDEENGYNDGVINEEKHNG